MNQIIHQITVELVEKIEKRILDGELSHLDSLASAISQDCSNTARQILQAVIQLQNRQLRYNKTFRKQEGLALKEKDRPRQILTRLGLIRWSRDYYFTAGRTNRNYDWLFN